MIVTLDGPAGAGKSSVVREVARRLGFPFLDTGAMYRAVAYAAIRDPWPLDQPDEVARRARELKLEVRADRVYLDGEDISDRLRTSEITDKVHYIADNPQVRDQLGKLQRQAAEQGDLVTEGRDQGTVVFPDAECKIFLTASAEERARRRLQELESSGEQISYEELLRAQQDRDQRDRSRPVGALMQAEDAVVVVSDGMTFDEVVEQIVTIVRQKMHALRQHPR